MTGLFLSDWVRERVREGVGERVGDYGYVMKRESASVIMDMLWKKISSSILKCKPYLAYLGVLDEFKIN